MHTRFNNFFWNLIDLVYPPTCAGCQTAGMRWCLDCQQQTTHIQPPICQICGQTINQGTICKRCATSTPAYKAIRSWAEFGGPIRDALHELKYEKNIGLGNALAVHLEELLQDQNWAITLIVPVPLGKQRLKQRGYNQADLLAKPLAATTRIPYNPKCLIRQRETRSQVELSRKERQANLKGAFLANQKVVRGKAVLIIDDVTTSGSTLNACAAALREAGANSAFGLTIARAVLDSN